MPLTRAAIVISLAMMLVSVAYAQRPKPDTRKQCKALAEKIMDQAIRDCEKLGYLVWTNKDPFTVFTPGQGDFVFRAFDDKPCQEAIKPGRISDSGRRLGPPQQRMEVDHWLEAAPVKRQGPKRRLRGRLRVERLAGVGE